MDDHWFHIPLQHTLGSDPFKDIDRMEHEMEELLDKSFPPSRYQLTHHGQTAPRKITHKTTTTTNEKIQIATLDIEHYKPEEITVKCEGGKLLVRGEHHSQGEHGFETGKFERKYDIPHGVDPKTITSHIHSNGVLSIEAPKPKTGPSQELHLMKPQGTFSGELAQDDKKYRVTLKCHNFKPEEITVTVKGNKLTVTGKHESEEEGHYHSSQFTRHFILPREVDVGTLQSKYSEGNLSIEADKTEVEIEPQIRQLTIENQDEKSTN